MDPTTMFKNSPLMIPMMHFRPKIKVGMQIAVCTVMLAALYATYLAVPQILAATDWSGYTLPDDEDADLQGWFMLLMPIVAVIPGIYIFLFLKYNFNH